MKPNEMLRSPPTFEDLSHHPMRQLRREFRQQLQRHILLVHRLRLLEHRVHWKRTILLLLLADFRECALLKIYRGQMSGRRVLAPHALK